MKYLCAGICISKKYFHYPLLNKIQECIDLSVMDDDEAGAIIPSSTIESNEVPADLSTLSSQVVDEISAVSQLKTDVWNNPSVQLNIRLYITSLCLPSLPIRNNYLYSSKLYCHFPRNVILVGTTSCIYTRRIRVATPRANNRSVHDHHVIANDIRWSDGPLPNHEWTSTSSFIS